jgi:hypothetical protein
LQSSETGEPVAEKPKPMPGKPRQPLAQPKRAPAYEESLRFTRELHDVFRGEILSGEVRIGSEDVTRLLTGEVQRSLGNLAGADMEVDLQEIEDGTQQDEL